MTVNTGVIDVNGNAIINFATGEWLIIEGVIPPPPDTTVGRFRFLKDHYVNDEYIFAGEVREMFEPWTPTADVEPLDNKALQSFYNMGPTLGACIRTQFTSAFIYKPATYWYMTAPNVWKLSGLGAGLSAISAIIGRIEDKAP